MLQVLFDEVFVPWRLAQIPHVQFQWGAFLALLLLFALRWLKRGRRRELFLFGLFFAWNALTNVHFAIFSGILLAVVLAWEGLTGDDPARRKRILGIVAATGVAANWLQSPASVRTSPLRPEVPKPTAGIVVPSFSML